MMKLLLLIVLAFIAYALWRSLVAKAARAAHTADRSPAAAAPESMVRCAQCGVHLPASEALVVRGHEFCCGEHAAEFRS